MEEEVDGEPESLAQDALVVVLDVGEVVQHPAGSSSRLIENSWFTKHFSEGF